MRKTNSWIVAGLAILAAGGLAGNAASAEEEALTLSVSYADLDLASDEDLDRLRSRIRRAGREACGVDSLFALGSVRAVQDAKACYRSIVEPALERAAAIASTRLAEASPKDATGRDDAEADADRG